MRGSVQGSVQGSAGCIFADAAGVHARRFDSWTDIALYASLWCWSILAPTPRAAEDMIRASLSLLALL